MPNAWGGIPAHLDLVNTYGKPTTQRWITEGGVKFQVPTPQAMTSKQQRAQARGFVVSTLTALSQGVDKPFPFSLPPLNEGSTFFGLLTRDWAPNAAFTAETAMTAALGHASYVGALPGLPAGVTAFAFDDGDDQVIALWAENPTDVTLDLGAGKVTRTTIVGASDQLTSADGRYRLKAQPDPTYLRVHGTQVVTGKSGLRPVTSTRSSVTLTPAQRVVVAQRYGDAARADSKAQGYRLSGDEANTVDVQLYNLNDVPDRRPARRGGQRMADGDRSAAGHDPRDVVGDRAREGECRPRHGDGRPRRAPGGRGLRWSEDVALGGRDHRLLRRGYRRPRAFRRREARGAGRLHQHH
ncbi:hypothetical protein [Streptomyces sp. NBC_00893]|uniref:hypothetical protein n=1 Tax=Streptomyces sp. NBC_00893 TaxID=2975862 RepID=UPI002257B432|nr:hypothetical protein [Streptomyces sp. NBC_00893]MCX4851575.1 hypothetical protein [Streptomyces sp. NBC_00893]